jgi:23S rRNA (uridine2552-2'-O)-methyltransferase
VELALEFALENLRADGALVCKVFHGSGYSQLVKAFKEAFRVVKAIKPKASRDRSAETFLVGIGLRQPAPAGGISGKRGQGQGHADPTDPLD